MPDTNGALGTIFDILTAGSPLKNKPVRKAIEAIGSALIGINEPHAAGFGTALVSLAKIFELREKTKRKRRAK